MRELAAIVHARIVTHYGKGKTVHEVTRHLRLVERCLDLDVVATDDEVRSVTIVGVGERCAGYAQLGEQLG